MDTIADDNNTAAVLALFRPGRLITSLTQARAEITDSLRFPLSSAWLLQKIEAGANCASASARRERTGSLAGALGGDGAQRGNPVPRLARHGGTSGHRVAVLEDAGRAGVPRQRFPRLRGGRAQRPAGCRRVRFLHRGRTGAPGLPALQRAAVADRFHDDRAGHADADAGAAARLRPERFGDGDRPGRRGHEPDSRPLPLGADPDSRRRCSSRTPFAWRRRTAACARSR